MGKHSKTILFGGLLLISNTLLAQSSQSQLRSSSLLVNVIDRKGDAVRTLAKDSFRVKVNGQPAAISEVSYSLAPRRIVTLLDMSGSMAGETGDKRWRIASEAIEDLLKDSPSDAPIALLTFSENVHDTFDFSQSRASVLAWLSRGASKQGDSRVHGRTAIFDAILAATRLLGVARAGDSIYVITDAGDNSSYIHSRAIRELLVSSQIRLFVFLLSELSPDMNAGSDSLKEIARATGGFVFGVSGDNRGVEFMPSWTYAFDYNEQTRQKIKLYTQALNIQVNGFYTLRFELPVAPEKARKVSLEIVNGVGKPRRDVAYTYSTTFVPLGK
jgi:Mg-chelatase subunit ChlD